MNRLGFNAERLARAYEALRAHPQVRERHADDPFRRCRRSAAASGAARLVRARWRAVRTARRARSPTRPRCCAFRETRGDWVRPGIMLYGCSPFADQSAGTLGLKPVDDARSELIAMQQLQRGRARRLRLQLRGRAARCASASWRAATPTAIRAMRRAARRCSSTGRRTRTVGRVSMDMIAIDVSDIPEAGIGTPVTLWGEGLSADEVGGGRGHAELRAALRSSRARVPVAGSRRNGKSQNRLRLRRVRRHRAAVVRQLPVLRRRRHA